MLIILLRFVKKHLALLLILFLLADTIYSYHQHLLFPVDGDLPTLIAPSEGYKHVLDDPLGLRVIRYQEEYAAPNRFFAHYTTYLTFRNLPLCLQSFMSPIDSLYVSIALVKTFIQISIILILGVLIALPFGINLKKVLISSSLITPFFQTSGFFEYMAVIDSSISYTMFYALPSLLLLIFMFPYYKAAFTGYSGLPAVIKPLWVLLIVVLALNGPLLAPILIIACGLSLFYLIYKDWGKNGNSRFYHRLAHAVYSIDKQLLFSFLFAIGLSLYSFYIGRYNSENSWVNLSLMERYARLPSGIVNAFFSFREGLFPIILFIVGNFVIISKIDDKQKRSIILALQILLVFSVIYMLMLPMGGYREYRPFILRRDTLQPVLIGLFYAYGISSFLVIKNLKGYKRYAYGFTLVIMAFMYTWRDHLPIYTNACERNSLKVLSESDADCLKLEENCSVLQWGVFPECDVTTYSAIMLERWNITSRPVKYFHDLE
ncbi:MAG: hypothetical protein ACK4ND_02605 [Cytophagaceae bacterium]